jgi:5-methylcytosine-specific restriction endonuclease McrA
MNFSKQYLSYIRSAEWQTRRKRALKLADYKCQVCGRRVLLQVHHNNYANLGNERDADLKLVSPNP